MSFKTFEQVSEKAVQIADNDPSARVAVFDLRVRQKVQDSLSSQGGLSNGVFKVHTLTYESFEGGVVKFYDAGSEVWMLVAGSMFTHVFCSEYVSERDKKLIASRIRYTKEPYPEPSGFYDFYGIVKRTEVW